MFQLQLPRIISRHQRVESACVGQPTVPILGWYPRVFYKCLPVPISPTGVTSGWCSTSAYQCIFCLLGWSQEGILQVPIVHLRLTFSYVFMEFIDFLYCNLDLATLSLSFFVISMLCMRNSWYWQVLVIFRHISDQYRNYFCRKNWTAEPNWTEFRINHGPIIP